MKKWIALICIFALVVSCQKSSSSRPLQILRINIQKDPQSLDPRKARDLNAITLLHMLFEGLVRRGADGSVELALAETMEVSENGLMYTFHLRDALWSNGEKVTSYDFVHSWTTLLDPQFPSDIAYQLFVIKGAKDAKMNDGDETSLGLQTPDERTLVVELEQPVPYFLELLTFPSFFPVCRKVDLKHQRWVEDAAKYVSNGPFLLSSWRHSDQIEVVRNPTYWDAKHVSIERIDLMMVSPETELCLFRNGELDWAGSPLSTLPSDALNSLKMNQTLQIRPLTGTYFLRVNTQEGPPLSHPLFRKALALSIDRQSIVNYILQGGQLPAQALVPPCMGLSVKGYFNDADEDEAQSLLSAFLEHEDLSLETLSPVKLLYSMNERNHAVAQTLQQQLGAALGIRLELEPVEGKSFYERVSQKNYQLAIGSWIADFNDPINFLEIFKYKDCSTNNTGWEDAAYTECLSLSALSTYTQERIEFLQGAELLLMEQMPVIPIFHFALNYVQNDKVKDVSLSPIGQIDFRWAYIAN